MTRPAPRAARATTAVLVLTALAGAAGAQGTPAPPAKGYEAVSLFGRPLPALPASAASLEQLGRARRDFDAAPTEDHYIWLGRRTAYAGRYREAIAIYTEGLSRFPESYRLYRHRGHRYISDRQFVRAIADFERAAGLVQGKPIEVEPDGAPNKAGVPVSNTQFNIYYHLGLAHFLARDFTKAEAAYRECLRWSKNDDSVVAVTDWLYMTLRRTGRVAEAARLLEPMRPGMPLLENGAYLDRLLMFKGTISEADFARPTPGETPPETAIRDYGLGMAALWRGDAARARDLFARQAGSDAWSSFATIASEVELAALSRERVDRSTPQSTLGAWVVAWNSYDLDLASTLFTKEPAPTYFSSERPGRIDGAAALEAHHRGFGFVPGGKTADARLWLGDLEVREAGAIASATATWLFDRDVASGALPQRGPVTFVLRRGGDGWRIAHAHFANDPPSPSK
jgi:tetratricopeptide (TPR) repeat protein/ketosteroid isomerase-like protein